MMTLWFAMSFGFLIRSAASVRWNSAKLRIIEVADIMAMFVVVEASWRAVEAADAGDVVLVFDQNQLAP